MKNLLATGTLWEGVFISLNCLTLLSGDPYNTVSYRLNHRDLISRVPASGLDIEPTTDVDTVGVQTLLHEISILKDLIGYKMLTRVEQNYYH